MTRAAWRLREVRPSQWWAVDDVAGTAYALGDAAASSLWGRHDLLTVALDHAVRLLAARPVEHHFVDLRFLDLTARYTSDDPAIVDAVAAAFAGARPRLRSSPGVVVELTGDVDVDRLHRSIDGERAGVRLRRVDDGHEAKASAALPVVPPVQLPPFAGRFCALHAALLSRPDGNVVVCGSRRAGKTTAALLAHRLGLATVLTDELVLVDATGAASGVALPVRERTEDDRVSHSLDPTDRGAELVRVDHVVVLTPTERDGAARRLDDISAALRAVAPHLRPLDGPLGCATGALLELLGRADVWQWHVRPWPQLPHDITAGWRHLFGGPA